MFPYSKAKSRPSLHGRLLINRRLSILPGRFQPSTFDVYGLNYCVRDGNRWNPIAVGTGYRGEHPLRSSVLPRTPLPWHFMCQPTRRFYLRLGCGPQNFTEETSRIFSRLRITSALRKRFTQTSVHFTLLTFGSLVLSQALDLLVSVSLRHCCPYTPDLSTLSSTRDLTSLCCERPHLKAGFTLRCFQRLSFPDVATQLYAWRHNWYTIGQSTPVLSY